MKAICFLFTLLVLQILCGPSYPSEHDTETASEIVDFEDPFCCSYSLATAVNDFSFKLFGQLGRKDRKNLFISPISISVALAVTYLGARGATASQMAKVLEYKSHDLEDSEIHQGFQRLIATLSKRQDEYSLLVANGMFLQQNYKVLQSYINRIRHFYRAALDYLDFAQNGQAAVNKINNWVAAKSSNAIKELFTQPLDPLTHLVLLNAVYFKGTWKTQFPKDNTYDGTFYRSGNASVMVKLMAIYKEKFRFLDDDKTGYKFVELPYKGSHIAMFVALPKKIGAPLNLKMSSELMCRLNSSMKTRELTEMILPSFKIEYESDLNDALKNMGMTELFISGAADLTGIRPENDLYVDKIFHKAIIDVNEQGSEAAAVTGVVIMPMSSSYNPTFVANHPFLFCIIDKRNGLVLFSGRVTDPTK